MGVKLSLSFVFLFACGSDELVDTLLSIVSGQQPCVLTDSNLQAASAAFDF